MICDHIKNLNFYRGLPPGIVRALEFLRDTNISELSLGKHELDGDRLFVLVQEYSTKPAEQCVWEAHRRYCDVQFVATGRERIGVAPIDRMSVTQPYDADRDITFFSGDGDGVTLTEGMFAIFAPQDVHMPCLAAGTSSPVRKLVFKVEL